MPAPKGNKHAVGYGRPPVYKNPEDLEKKILEYFETAPDKRTIVSNGNKVDIPVYTISGLCYFLGFESRQSFYDYGKRDSFSYLIKKASLFLQKIYEENLHFANPTGSIFALKNIGGWTDKQELEHKGDGLQTVIYLPKENDDVETSKG